MALSPRRAGGLAGIVLVFAVLAFVHWRLHPFAFDDAYIHFRIARHLAEHGVPYYNLGEAVMASSSSVWTIVLAILFACGATPAALALVNAALTTACVPVYARLIAAAAGEATGPCHHVAAAAVVVPVLLMASVGLMETPLAILCAGVAMRLFQRGRPQAFAVFAAAAFVRPEWAVAGAICGVFALATRRMRLGEMLAWGAAGALPFVAYDLYFFHTLIPNAVRAKSLGYDLRWRDALPKLSPPIAGSYSLLDWAVASAAALVAGAVLLFRRPMDMAARASFLGGLAIAFAYVAPRGFIFEWYVPLYMVPVLWPLAACFFQARAGTPRYAPRRAAAAAALAVLLLPWVAWMPAFARGAAVNPALSPLFPQGGRVRQYIEVARELSRRYPHATLLSSEVGGLGYGFPGPIADAFGLISPAAMKYHPMRVPEERSSGKVGAIPPRYVAEANPELIVSYSVFADALARSPVIAGYAASALPLFTESDARTAAAVGVPRSLWGVPMVLEVWVRKDVAAASGLPFSDTPLPAVSKP
jgi:hypothetical protein